MSEYYNNIKSSSASRKTNGSEKTKIVLQSSTVPKETRQSQISLSDAINQIKQQQKALIRDLRKYNTEKILLTQIDKWEKETIAYINSKATKTKLQLKQIMQNLNKELNQRDAELSDELNLISKSGKHTESGINRCKTLLEKSQLELRKICAIKINTTSMSSLQPIEIVEGTVNSSSENTASTNDNPMEIDSDNRNRELPVPLETTIRFREHPYPSVLINGTKSNTNEIYQLFEKLRCLNPMDKNGPMSGNCDAETTQMETFLSQTFDFKNRSTKCIVQGVKSFRFGKPLETLDPQRIIYFPKPTEKSFAMSIQEIINWQQSYKVYADQTVKGMNNDFLCKALEGLSESGKEAFRMKFVVRISQCPILMEFDARLITRELKDQWPSRIKLVSVTGIDFAGRIHDIDDIRTYVSNWKDVYEIDSKTGLPFVYNGRDFHRKHGAPRAELEKDRLLTDLIRMARLRLHACDKEKIQIVVETGIGLGVFAGKNIGIDAVVRALSAKAIRTVLEQDGSNYEHIRGIVFALPIFDKDIKNDQRNDVYQAFVDEFDQSKYNGCIPVLIADQDMHRLTVAIAREDFSVSELNPADSHGVFGEYWQNRGPAVEEKLALTTLGLLVQHHLINPYVLDPKHYRLVQPKT
ncbi:unnamed protein product [Adineta steineri]|uniref:Uncharacterized protein n=1 Tax=Adineta steineri TaxID=433720 RepID=A0A819MLB8_9BILA|nr:unnamed protein product [Adineta steineri]CAF3981715.1 unnamed protein product [Adineta steineri]